MVAEHSNKHKQLPSAHASLCPGWNPSAAALCLQHSLQHRHELCCTMPRSTVASRRLIWPNSATG
jgi:hypothetical protein